MAKKRTKKVAPPPPRKKRPRAQALPGMEHKVIPALEDAIAEWGDARDQRMELSETEKTSKQRVIAQMQAHGLMKYQSTVGVVERTHGDDDVKLRKSEPVDLDDDDAPDIDDVHLAAPRQ